MIILFEDYPYDEEAIKTILPADLLSYEDKGKAKTTFVGYFFSVPNGNEVPVFILPKVFVKDGKPLGIFDELDVNINIQSISEKMGKNCKINAEILSNLPFVLYQAISKYKNRHPDTTIVRAKNVQEVKSVGEYEVSTIMEIILSLRKFNKEHQDLFTFIITSNRSGARNINWNKTTQKVLPIMQKGTPIYMDFINKQKSINYDEEIIVLFYSVLNYLGEKYFFHEPVNFNFDTLPTSEIEQMISEGSGTIRLHKIRHKYFTDSLVQLWHLLYVFFEKSEKIACKDYMKEELLVTSFNNVFEDMIDQLISDNKLTSLKKNKDGKIIDHLYTDNSLINNGNVYFIADSKYYKDSSDLGETAVYKQFTYARNIIQHNLNLYQKNPSDKNYLPAMRDELTDGYNIVPNYFIRGSVIDSDGNLYNYEDDGLINEFDKDHKAPTSKLVNFHFPNRLFDRDTMVLQTYNINFIYVVAKYIEGEDEIVKAEIHKKFREDLIKRFDNLYQFYILKPISTTLEDALNMHFRQLAGKVIHPFKDADYLILALEKCENGNTETKLTKVSKIENDNLLKKLNIDFCVSSLKLNEL